MAVHIFSIFFVTSQTPSKRQSAVFLDRISFPSPAEIFQSYHFECLTTGQVSVPRGLPTRKEDFAGLQTHSRHMFLMVFSSKVDFPMLK
jgi:hypothetical protein